MNYCVHFIFPLLNKKNAPTTIPNTAKLFSCMIMLVNIVQSTPTWKYLIGKSFSTHCIHQTLLLLMITCSDLWYMACLSSTSHWVDSSTINVQFLIKGEDDLLLNLIFSFTIEKLKASLNYYNAIVNKLLLKIVNYY